MQWRYSQRVHYNTAFCSYISKQPFLWTAGVGNEALIKQ